MEQSFILVFTIVNSPLNNFDDANYKRFLHGDVAVVFCQFKQIRSDRQLKKKKKLWIPTLGIRSFNYLRWNDHVDLFFGR